MELMEVIGPMALTVSTKITGLMEFIEIFMEAWHAVRRSWIRISARELFVLIEQVKLSGLLCYFGQCRVREIILKNMYQTINMTISLVTTSYSLSN